MKRGYIWVVALAFLLMASQAFAQYSRRGQIELYGGAAFPMAPEGFKDYFKMGYSLHGQYVMFPSPSLGISFGAAYELFAFNSDAVLEDALAGWGEEYEDYFEVEGNMSIVELGIGIRPYISSPQSSNQIFLFGMGTYNLMSGEAKLKYDIPGYGSGEEDSGEWDDDYFGIAAGAGMELPFGSSMNLILQGLYRFIFTEEETTSFIGVTAGLVL